MFKLQSNVAQHLQWLLFNCGHRKGTIQKQFKCSLRL